MTTTPNLFPVEPLNYLYINGLQITNDATTPNTILDISTGQCNDQTATIDMAVTSPLTINSGISGVGGLDVGTLTASKFYGIFLIGDSRNQNVPAGLMSLSFTAPTIPFGYDSWRLIGYARVDGSSHFLKMYVTNGVSSGHRQLMWDSVIGVLSGGTATTLTAVDLSAAVPAINNIPVLFVGAYTPATAGDAVRLAAGGSAATLLPYISGSVAAVAQAGTIEQMATLQSGVPKVSYINSAASGSASFSVVGFKYSV